MRQLRRPGSQEVGCYRLNEPNRPRAAKPQPSHTHTRRTPSFPPPNPGGSQPLYAFPGASCIAFPNIYAIPLPPLPGELIRLDDLTCNCDSADAGVQQETWKAITARVKDALLDLERRCPPNPDQSAVAPKRDPPPS